MSVFVRSFWLALGLAAALCAWADMPDGELYFDSPLLGDWTVFRVLPDGSQLTPLTDVAPGRYPALDQVGLTLVTAEPEGVAWRRLMEPQPERTVEDLQVRDLVFVGDDYLLGVQGSSIVKLTRDGEAPEVLFTVNGTVSRPMLHRDANRIVYGLAGRGVFSARMEDGQDVQRLVGPDQGEVAGAEHDFAPCLMANGERLAYINPRGHLCIIDTNGQHRTVLDTGQCRAPSFSPCARYVAYWTEVGDAQRTYWQLAVRNLETGERTLIGPLHPQPGWLLWGMEHRCA